MSGPALLRLSNAALELCAQPETGGIRLLDRRRGVAWNLDTATRGVFPNLAAPPGRFTGGTATVLDACTLREDFVALGQRISYCWHLLPDGVAVTLTFDHTHCELEGVTWPGSFGCEGDKTVLALPIMQGLLYDGRGAPFEQMLQQGGHENFSMAMAGYLAKAGGLLLAVDDYADWRAVVGKRSDGGIYAYALALSSLGELRYPRRVRLLLTDPGVTALCKRYRRCVQERGDWKPWSEKIVEQPSLARLFGGLMTFVGYNAATIDYVDHCRRLRDFGFDRAFIFPVRFNQYPTDFKMGGDAPICLGDDEIRAIRALGFDVAPWNWVFEGLNDGTDERRRLFLRDAAGRTVPCWRIDDYQWHICCPSVQPEFMRAAYREDLRDMTWGHYDVSASRGLLECHALDHPRHAGHPMDRREHLQWLRELLGPRTNGDRPVSSEGFHDAVASAYAIGTTKLLPAFGAATFWTVPMTMLVYHDSVIHDWWELHNYNAHAGWNHVSLFGRKADGCGRDKAALDALYGCPPNVFPFGRQYQWVNEGARTTRSYSVNFDDASVQEALGLALPVARLHRRTGPLELMSHEFLSDDGAVQETVFADGTRVVANFADDPREAAGVGTLPAKTWRPE